MRRQVLFYKTATGRCPVREFLDSLSGKAAQKVVWTLTLLEELDRLPTSYFKKLTNTEEIWEVRVLIGSDSYRIFCFYVGANLVVLTHGLAKKSQKTPVKEIQRAERYRRDYIARRN